MKGEKKYEALLFDLDGTLFDTRDLNFSSYKLAYKDLGVEITKEMFDKTEGCSVFQFNEIMGVECDVERLRQLKAEYYRGVVEYAKPNWYLLNIIYSCKIPMALVTTARMENIAPLLMRYNLFSYFKVIVSQADVKNHKPAPDAYILACNELKKLPWRCLAFEDSRQGIAAAQAAEVDCVRVNIYDEECIRNMSGGSDATTKLFYDVRRNSLFVRKQATEPKAVERLYNQYKFLCEYQRIIPSLVGVKSLAFQRGTGNIGRYDMPYVEGFSLYEHPDRMSAFERALESIHDMTYGEYVDSTEEIRKRCMEKYVIPGMEIYVNVTKTGRSVPDFGWEDLPEDINRYRRSIYHGDTTMENIIVTKSGQIRFIDPVPDGNMVRGYLHDLAKVGQSLMGYEAIRDGKDFDYSKEIEVYNKFVRHTLTPSEFCSLKFHIACLFFRRLKHQVEQRPELVKAYGDIAYRLLNEYRQGNYLLK